MLSKRTNVLLLLGFFFALLLSPLFLLQTLDLRELENSYIKRMQRDLNQSKGTNIESRITTTPTNTVTAQVGTQIDGRGRSWDNHFHGKCSLEPVHL